MEPVSLDNRATDRHNAATDHDRQDSAASHGDRQTTRAPAGWVGAHGAREGSLENPEVLKDVPGHIIPILRQEFDDFDTESTRYLKGELEGDEFIKFRLRQGVYGQRQPDVQMIRVKLPLGGVTPEQLDAFAAGI